MAWYSILPTHLTVYETWIIRGFLLLAVINLLPWILAILYDACLYVGRVIYHEIPFFGGRARGEHRPRAPSLRDRVRRMSFVDLVTGSGSAPSTPTRGGTRRDTNAEKRKSDEGPRQDQT
ncbi:hypothetical protein LTS17_006295 [Exophiala oligosperma]